MQTFRELAERVAACGDRAVLSCEGRGFNGSETIAEARRIARALLAAGVERGDRVCLWVPNCPEFVFVELAVTLIGAVFVPIQSRYGATELGNILGRAEPVVLIYQSRFLQFDLDTIVERVGSDIDCGTMARFPSLRRIVSLDGSRHRADQGKRRCGKQGFPRGSQKNFGGHQGAPGIFRGRVAPRFACYDGMK
ncbi:MAG: AMP-binding protein [Rhizobiales bacterium]|nr:AMP-binding protein [Hyphomicrobiales bacterium]